MNERGMEKLRRRMIEDQLVRRGIVDERVLAAFRTVPRHRFVPPELARHAYEDCPLPIGEGQTISQPFMVALMTDQLRVQPGDKVLEVGSGSGYQAAILVELGAKVFTIEYVEDLATLAKDNLEKTGYKNVQVKVGDGTLGWPEASPFNGIVVTAGAPQIPEPLLSQLADGGRLVIPLGGRFSQILTRITKTGGELQFEESCGCVFVPLLGRHGWSS